MSMASKEIQEMFLEESKEILVNLETDILKLEGNYNKELFDNIFRYVHTLKGSSGIAGYDLVYEFSHQLENLMDLVRSKVIGVSEEVIDLLLASLDWFNGVLFGNESEKKVADGNKEILLSKIFNLISTSGRAEAPTTSKPKEQKKKTVDIGLRYYKIHAKFHENVYEFGIDPFMILEDLMSNGLIIKRKVDRKRIPVISKLNPEKCYHTWEIVFETELDLDRLNDIFIFVQDESEIKIEDVTDKYLSEDFDGEKKIGEILIDKGIISEDDLSEVISEQENVNTKFGDLIVGKGLVSKKELDIALKEQESVKKRMEYSTIRVDTGKLDSLLNLLGEIVISQSAINRISEELEEEKSFRLKNSLHGLDRITREFQEQIMSIRMVPIGPTFEQFRRFVRDASKTSGKNINFEIEGRETELDKTVIEKIGDPLKHMIRNSIDHGIETSEERKKHGKPEQGNLTLKAYHQEGNVYIQIRDDGKGIDPKKIRQKAISMGLLAEDEEVNEARLFSFLFYPGFSTAEKIGDLSGRGVGMDVVKTNIEALRGTINIDSKVDKGTTITVKLPLTLAIIEGMLVRVGKYTYIIPLLSIVESIQPKKETVKTVESKGEVVMVRGEYVSLVKLYDFFNIEADKKNPWEGLIVVVESGENKVGILVDELIGQQQIVIKSLGHNNLTSSRALSGAAILGNGSVALIIDIHGLVSDFEK